MIDAELARELAEKLLPYLANGYVRSDVADAIVPVLANVRLEEAKWWAEEAGHDTIPTNNPGCNICERLIALSQAAKPSPTGPSKSEQEGIK